MLQPQPEEDKVKLPFYHKLAYGVGHVYNDLCAAVWFSYMLLYLQNVVGLSGSLAGYLLFIGQTADAACTPLVGYFSDRSSGCYRFGRRKCWHAVGTVAVTLSFPLLLVPCPFCPATSGVLSRFIYCAFFIIVFQFGWASVQVAHLAMIPEMVCHPQKDTVELNAIRLAWTQISTMAVYITTLILLNTDLSSEQQRINKNDAALFRTLALVIVAVGLLFTALFQYFTPEVKLSPTLKSSSFVYERLKPDRSDQLRAHSSKESDDLYRNTDASENTDMNVDNVQPCCSSYNSRSLHNFNMDTKIDGGKVEEEDDLNMDRQIVPEEEYHDGRKKISWKDWIKEPQFYQIALIYTCARLAVNICQVYIPLYLTESLKLKKMFIAITPLTFIGAGFLVTIATKRFDVLVGRKVLFAIGTVLVVASCVWLVLIPEGVQSEYMVLIPAFLGGAASTTVLVQSSTFVADLIGSHIDCSAFVYGSMGLFDKFLNGVILVSIQYLYPCPTSECCAGCSTYYRGAAAITPATAALVALLLMLSLGRKPIGQLSWDRRLVEYTTDEEPEHLD